MTKFLHLYQRVVVTALVILMAFVVLLATIDLAWLILRGLFELPLSPLAIDRFLEILAAFLLVLVGLELLDTIKAYLAEHVVHAEIVLIAAIIAVARKVITIDPKETSPVALIGVAAMLGALTFGYYLFKRADQPK